MSNYRKFLAAIIGTVAVGLAVFGLDDNPETIFGMSVDQVTAVVASLLGAFGVWGFSNTPSEPTE